MVVCTVAMIIISIISFLEDSIIMYCVRCCIFVGMLCDVPFMSDAISVQHDEFDYCLTTHCLILTDVMS